MSPTVGKVSIEDERIAQARIAGGETLPNLMGVFKFEADHVRARWARHDGEPWQMMWCVLSGPRILKSGKRSPDHRGTWHLGDDVPDWLASWLKLHEPTDPAT